MTDDAAIKVEGLGKRYRIGVHEEEAEEENLAGSMAKAIISPLRNFRKYRSLYNFDDDGEAKGSNQEDIIWALKDINFEVPRGQVMGIVGTNGAGKSTLLKILCNITPPTHGRIEILGRVGSLLEVGTGFHPELTGRENVYLNGTVLGMRKKEVDIKFDEIIAFSGIEKFLDTPVKRYSSGMRVRLAFAVAAHLEPEILIIDEVLAVGDAAFQRKCLDKMDDIGQEGRTVLFVSHNMPAVTRLCSRAILLNQGQMIMEGNAPEVVSSYLTEGHGITSYREWPDDSSAPGDSAVRLLRFRVKDSSGANLEVAECGNPIGLELEYEVLEAGRTLMPYLIAWDDNGNRLFMAVDTDPTWCGKPRPAGRYTTTAWIPANLLSEGTIYLNCAMKSLEPTQKHFHVKQEVAFQVVDKMVGHTARGNWAGSMPGAFRPLLDWETAVQVQAHNSKIQAIP